MLGMSSYTHDETVDEELDHEEVPKIVLRRPGKTAKNTCRPAIIHIPLPLCN